MHNVDNIYLNLLKDILENGTKKSDRTGTGTISVFSREIRFKMSDGFPLLTTKKMFTKGIIHELLWFLRGDTNIKYLVDNNCNIWNGDAYKNYLNYPLPSFDDYNINLLYKNIERGWCVMTGRSFTAPHPTRHLTQEEFIEKIKTDELFAKKWGELGPVYGKQWRKWGGIKKVPSGYEHGAISHYDEIPIGDQISEIINTLKDNPDSRRIMVNAWNVAEINDMVLPPCHYGFQLYTRELTRDERLSWYSKNSHLIPPHTKNQAFEYEEKYVPKRALSLKWNQRSVDTFLGLPFNIASYAFLLHMIAQQVNMVPDELIGSLGDVHLYLNHIDQVNEQLNREPMKLSTLELNKATDIFNYSIDDFKIINYNSHPTIKADLSN